MSTWKTVAADGFPQCDGHTTFIGINSAGYACCFNAMRGGLCVMETAEGSYRQMSDLRDWRLLDRPAHGVAAPVETDPPKSIPRSEFTGEQLRAAYEVCTASVRTAKRNEGPVTPDSPADANPSGVPGTYKDVTGEQR